MSVSLRELFAGFTSVGLSGFGGVLPWARRMIVEQRRWIDDPEFDEMLALCSTLPGPNIVNIAVALGARLRGFPGAAAALSGLLGPPLALVLGMMNLYERYGQAPVVQGALRGIAAVAAGLVLAMGGKMALRLRHSPRRWTDAGIALAAFAAVGRAALAARLGPACPRAAFLGGGVVSRKNPRSMSPDGESSPSLGKLAVSFALLSMVAVGGANAVIPDIHRQFVVERAWLGENEFTGLVALATAAPGPNVLLVALIGWKLAGLAGALVSAAAMCGPSSLLTFAFARAWWSRRWAVAPWRTTIQRALAPIPLDSLWRAAG